MTIDEGLSVRGISCDFVYRGSDNLRPRRKGARTLQACGHWTRNRCKRPRRAYVVARRWPGSSLAAIEVTDSSRDALQSLVDNRDLRLMRLGLDQDRYGRVVAFVHVGDRQQSIQEMLVEQGQARVAARIGDKVCADILLRSERVARAARRGLWADPNFAPLRPENLARIAAAQGQFALVEGKVLSVRESGATIYLNFGRRWTRDFTVTILKRHRREFAAAGIDPKGLEGRPIRVCGWIEQRGGPVIDAVAPEQIERVE
ncbi:MAG: thermonuclease family protein [Pseudolabrys sp.]